MGKFRWNVKIQRVYEELSGGRHEPSLFKNIVSHVWANLRCLLWLVLWGRNKPAHRGLSVYRPTRNHSEKPPSMRGDFTDSRERANARMRHIGGIADPSKRFLNSLVGQKDGLSVMIVGGVEKFRGGVCVGSEETRVSHGNTVGKTLTGKTGVLKGSLAVQSNQ